MMNQRFVLHVVAILVIALPEFTWSSSVPGNGEDFGQSLRDLMHELVRRKRSWTAATGKTSFTQEEIKLITNMHNAYRSTVSPPAADMLELEWHDGLAQFAQTFLNKCTGQHNSNRNYDTWQGMAENIYRMPGSLYDDQQALKLWTDEGTEYNISTHTCTHAVTCSHYLSVVWAKTEKIGCAIKKCDTITDRPDLTPPVTFFLCNYSGRFLTSAKPYTVGTKCSLCPSARSLCRHSLCVTEDMVEGSIGYNGDTSIIGIPIGTDSDSGSSSGTGSGTDSGSGSSTDSGSGTDSGTGSGSGTDSGIGSGSGSGSGTETGTDSDEDDSSASVVASNTVLACTLLLLHLFTF